MAKVIDFPEPASLSRTERVFAALDEQFSDSRASAESIGLEAGIGPRRVKAILAEQKTCLRAELLERRMAKARDLLTKTDFAVRYVANLSGYRCQSHFAKRFAAQHEGQSPRDYRIANGGRRRVGGTTGAFRKAAQRARARKEGVPAPSMSAWRTLPGYDQAKFAEWQNERRHALLYNEPTPPLPPPSSDVFQYDDPYLDAYIDAYMDEIDSDWELDDEQ